jgi:hypothetical protein
MRNIAVALALILLAASPSEGASQSMFELLESLRNGGAWVSIPIEAGSGGLVTDELPTLGLTLRGCVQVYAGHSGRWDIRARDTMGEGRLEAEVAAGEPVRFSYTTGSRAQLSVDARWSEARDTTLMVWVGLETSLSEDRDPCAPVYGGGSVP